MHSSTGLLAGAAALFLHSSGSAAQPAPPQAQPAATAPAPREITLSKEAYPAVKALEAAVIANDAASIPAKLAAAQAVAKTPADRYMVAQLQLRAAIASGGGPAKVSGLEAVLASGGADPDETARLSLSLAELHYKAKQFDKAGAAFERVLALDPKNTQVMALLAETRQSQGRSADALAMLNKAIATRAAAGQKADELYYKRAVAIAYKAQLPEVYEASRQWVAAYPGKAAWRDAIRIYREQAKLKGQLALDSLRLARAAGALEGDSDYGLYIYEAVDGGTPGEAKALMAEAVTARAIDLAKAPFNEMDRPVRIAAAAESLGLAKKTEAALAGPAARPLLAVGDSHFGRGDYARAAELYRAALGKSGADGDLINLHLGMALARQGDKAGAQAALRAAGGAQSELAKYWLLFANASS